MITINLLPQDLRIKEIKKIYIPYRQIGLIVFLIFLTAALFNLVTYVRVRQEYRKLDREWKSLADKNTEAQALEKELGATILAEIDFYDAYADPPLEAARMLNLISDLAPNRIWLDQLDFERVKDTFRLSLNGFSGSSGKASKLVEIQKFTNDLKDQLEKEAAPSNPNVKRHLKVTVATSSEKREGQQEELARFTANFKTDEPEQK